MVGVIACSAPLPAWLFSGVPTICSRLSHLFSQGVTNHYFGKILKPD
jgi:hypothetical protein